jgi:hypothetical protein
MMGSGAVHFADYLKMLPSAWVFEHFIQGTDSTRKILSSSMIDETVSEFTKPEHLRQQFLTLNKSDQLKCAIIYLLGETGLETTDFQGLENSLLLSFLVYAAINKNGTIRLLGFDEFREVILDLCADILYEHVSDKEPTEPVSVWPYRSVNDITIAAVMAAQKLLKKKKNGGLTRVASQQLKSLTDMGAEFKNENGDYVNNLVISYCIKAQILFETDVEYLLNTPGFNSWLLLDVEDRYKDLANFIFSFTGGWWMELLDVMLQKEISIPLGIFPENIQNQLFDSIKGLRFAGVVELRKKEKEISFCKTKQQFMPSDQDVSKVMILPDFSVVIAQEIESNELYRFAQVGAFMTFDRVYKGKIDKTVLGDALSRGFEGTRILEWLEQWHAPGNVTETVREWLREFYRLYITDRRLLVSSDERVTRQIDSFAPLRALVEQVPAHALYMIKKGNEEKVREILKNLGFDYRMPGQDLDAEIPQLTVDDQLAVQPPQWVPLIEPKSIEGEPPTMRGTKYGGELKVLDISEITHVIDYAILTGQNLVIDYEGSPYIKEGLYTIKPLSCQKGIEPVLEAEMTRTHSRKQIYIKKIRKIGVQSR